MYERILVPTDGSDEMGAVFDHAVELATTHGAAVDVLYVVDDRAFLTLADDLKKGVLADLRERGERATRVACERFETGGVQVDSDVRQGNPGEVIVEYAAERDADCIVMGSHADYEANMLGSVSRRVVAGSPVPVLTVGLGPTDEEQLRV